MIKSLNLCLTNHCSARCIFCPTDRGLERTENIMSPTVFESALKWAKEFENLEQITIGENGDAFINRNCIEYLREIKKRYPDAKKILFTNFVNFHLEKIEIVVKENLVDEVICNIDSCNPDIYEKAKKIFFSHVWSNFWKFINLREEYKSKIKLGVYILNPQHYQELFSKIFNQQINRPVTGCKNDIEETFGQLSWILREGDSLNACNPCFWAERDTIRQHGYPLRMEKFNFCPQIDRIKTEAFIAPNGDWYACCLDSRQEMVIGNIMSDDEQTLERNHDCMVALLEAKEFKSIGSPCDTAVCCHNYVIKNKGEKNGL